MEKSGLMKKQYSKFALGAAVFMAAAIACQVFNGLVLSKVLPDAFVKSSAFSFLNIIVPEYVIGFPLFLLLTLKMDKQAPEKNKFGFGRFIVCLFLMIGAIGVGMVIGTALNWATTLPFGVNMADTNALGTLLAGSNPFWRILTVGILAPIVEELVFRKFLIDRTVKYGEWVAIITSALMFGIFHANLAQCFYAAFIGGIFAYVYIRTGKIWYTIIYHMIFNLSTSIVTVTLLGMVDYDKVARMAELSTLMKANPNDTALQSEMVEVMGQVWPLFALYGWFAFLGLLALVGIVIWIIVLARKKIKIQRREEQVEKGMKYAWGNVGMIVFLVVTIGLAIANYLIMVIPAIKK